MITPLCLIFIVIEIIQLFSAGSFAQERDSGRINESDMTGNYQNTQKDTVNLEWKPCVSAFAELLGKGWLSLNVDFRRKETYAISIAATILEEGFGPNVMFYYFGGRRHRLEMGGGASGIIEEEGFNSMMVHGVIGYRSQKKKGLLFRTGFTPMFEIPFTEDGKFVFIPWVGLSLGYSF